MCQLLRKDAKLEFTQPCKEAFDHLKDLLTSIPIIQPPNWDLPFEIMCDTSNTTVGAVLGQKVDRTHHVIYYASKMLDGTQSKYNIVEKSCWLFSLH